MTRTPARRRTGTGALRARTGSSALSRSTTFRPKTRRMRLGYQDEFRLLVLNYGSVTGQTWSCNGPYDPDVTAAGHQPRYYDQLVAQYGAERVRQSAISVRFSTMSPNEMIVGIYEHRPADAHLTSQDILTFPRCIWRRIKGASTTGPVCSTVVKYNFNSRRFFGNKAAYSASRGETDYAMTLWNRAGTSLEIGRQAQWRAFAFYPGNSAATPATPATNVAMETSIVYDVEFAEPKVIEGS